MPMGSVLLRPGVDLERTPSLNEAGISESQLIRTKNGLTQTIGGWVQYGTTIIPSTVKSLHAWQDIAENKHLSAAATQNVMVLSSATFFDRTPQIFTSSFAPSFTTTASSFQVLVADPNSGATVYDIVYFNTPVAIDDIVLNGPYQITSVLSTGIYTINSSAPATAGIASSGELPGFNTLIDSPTVTVTLHNHGYEAITGLSQQFIAPTTVDGLTIQGPYTIASVISSNQFTINSDLNASATSSATMNNGLVQMLYYVTGGPTITGTPFGFGAFGAGAFGGVGGVFPGTTGTPITATDWSQDNWGEALLACPKDGPIYLWSPETGYHTLQPIATAPFFNGGIFVSQPQQILVAWKSTLSTGVQDNLVVRWSNALDYKNWTVSNQTTAGSFHIPTGSVIIGGLQAPNYGVIWTDIDVWIMSYVGGVVIFNFTRVGTGCGLIGQHAAGVLAGNVYWCGTNNFFTITQGGVEQIPCTVWDFIFQNLNAENSHKIVCATNSVFNEITWFFPSINATENDSYVKLNIVEKTWDYGTLSRTAWTDVTILGNPIGADTFGFLYQHEVGENVSAVPGPSFKTGWWQLTEGNDIAFVDFVLPDFKWGIYSDLPDAEVNVTFYSADYPGDTPRSYGPYTVTKATEYLTPRIRGRLMAVQAQSNNAEFWRLGRIRFRYAISGRR